MSRIRIDFGHHPGSTGPCQGPPAALRRATQRGGRRPYGWATLLWVWACCPGLLAGAEDLQTGTARGDLILVVGSPGTDEYATLFRGWGNTWQAAAQAGGLRVTALGLQQDDATLEKLQAAFANTSSQSALPLWIVLIGHGTFDGRSARFNLPGADLEPADLSRLCNGLDRPLAVINCFSASAPFLAALAGPNRVVMTATSSGNEVNLSRFGGFLAESIDEPAADLDKDQQTSLLEAFLRAVRLTNEFYAADGRLVTEHALIDDNGDGRAVSADAFEGIRSRPPADKSAILPDGIVAHQWHLAPGDADAALSPEVLARRNELELRIAQLRGKKSSLAEDEYYSALEALLLDMAKLLVK